MIYKKSLIYAAFILLFFAGCTIHTVSRPNTVRKTIITVGAQDPVIYANVPAKEIIDGTTPLIHAASINDFERVRFLVENGEDVNETHYSSKYEPTALLETVRRGNSRIAEYLIRSGAQINWRVNDTTPFETAVKKNNFALVKLMVLNGADMRSPGILQDAVHESDTVILSYLLSNGAGKRSDFAAKRDADYALLKACKLGNLSAMKLLLRAGADPDILDAKGRGLIFYAAQKNNGVLLEFVFNSSKVKINAVDEDGYTPLMLAVEAGNLQGVTFLVNKGADIDIQNRNKHDALHFAKKPEIERYLRSELPKRKAPPNAQHKYEQRNDRNDKSDANKRDAKDIKLKPDSDNNRSVGLKIEKEPQRSQHNDDIKQPQKSDDRREPVKEVKPAAQEKIILPAARQNDNVKQPQKSEQTQKNDGKISQKQNETPVKQEQPRAKAVSKQTADNKQNVKQASKEIKKDDDKDSAEESSEQSSTQQKSKEDKNTKSAQKSNEPAEKVSSSAQSKQSKDTDTKQQQEKNSKQSKDIKKK
ncbi:MAG: ankyrin repeat domain-containing protein [Endomicrobium sp.]|jgi:ankyrin repeat protein|nr:ankyrin repeat domain-containing protein [Endomicrobium sp.]